MGMLRDTYLASPTDTRSGTRGVFLLCSSADSCITVTLTTIQTQAEPLKGGQYATQEKEGKQCRHDRFEGMKDTGDRSREIPQAHRK